MGIWSSLLRREISVGCESSCRLALEERPWGAQFVALCVDAKPGIQATTQPRRGGVLWDSHSPMALSILPSTWLLGMALPHS